MPRLSVELPVHFQFDKGLFRHRPFGGGVAGCLVLREQVFDPLVIGFSHGNGISGLCLVILT
jgi:hypothetical protein